MYKPCLNNYENDQILREETTLSLEEIVKRRPEVSHVAP